VGVWTVRMTLEGRLLSEARFELSDKPRPKGK
jgi:hypothetical protein